MSVNSADKLDLLLLVGGEELQKLVETLPGTPTDYVSHVAMLDEHFKAYRNNTLELYKFFSTEWPADMLFTDFETKCREQGLLCNFPVTLDNAIVMMAVVKTQNGEFRNEVIRKNGDLKSVRELAKAYEIAKESREVINSQQKSAPKPEYEGEVRKVSGPGRYSMRSRGQAPANLPTHHSCTGCGSAPHAKPEVCIARGKRCLRCGAFNHFARVCPNKKNSADRQVRALASAQEQGANAADLNESVYLYQVTKGGSPSPIAVVKVNGKPLKLHIDTQADVTVITEKHFAKLEGVSELLATSVKVRGFSGDGMGPPLPLKGCFQATLGHSDKNFNETVYVVQGHGKTALLSRQATEGLGLVEYHLDQLQKSIQPTMGEESQVVHDMVQEYHDVFQGIGKLKDVTVKLQVDPSAKGVIQKQRRVSIPLKDKFDQILDRWEELDIIEDVGDEPTEWCSNVVLTPKKDGESIRASLDMTDANKYILRTRHAIPTLRELEAKLNGARYFSHLDMTVICSWNWQKKVENSRHSTRTEA